MSLQERGVIKCGKLTKSPPLDTKTRKRWHARYFVLYDPARIQRDTFEYSSGRFQRTPSFSERASRCLQRKNTVEEPSFLSLLYYKDEEAKKKGVAPINTISLEGATVDESTPIRGYKYVINLKTEVRMFHLCADTQDDHKSWLQALQKVLSRNVPGVHTSSSAPMLSKKSSFIEEVPPEKNSMIQQLIEWKRERLLLEQENKDEPNADAMWLENKLIADQHNITADDNKKDSGFSEKYGLYNSNSDVNETNIVGETNDDDDGDDDDEEAFQDRINRLSLESMQSEKTDCSTLTRTSIQRGNTINSYHSDMTYDNTNPEGLANTQFYTKNKLGRSRSVETSSSRYYNNIEVRKSDELCTDSYSDRPFSDTQFSCTTESFVRRTSLPWQSAISDDGFEEEESGEDEPPALPEKSYKTLSRDSKTTLSRDNTLTRDRSNMTT